MGGDLNAKKTCFEWEVTWTHGIQRNAFQIGGDERTEILNTAACE